MIFLIFTSIMQKKIIKNGDNVVVLTDKGLYPDYVKALGKKHVAIAPMHDIWMRDSAALIQLNPSCSATLPQDKVGAKKGQTISDEVQDEFKYYSQKAGLQFTQSKLLNDGGNWVENGYGNLVLSTKFLADNKLTESEARKKLMALIGAKQIAFIEADEQGGLEHADGVVSFVEQNTLVINAYPSRLCQAT